MRATRRLWTLGISGLAGVVVLAATLTGAISLAMQGAPQYRDLVMQRASALLHRPVTIGSMRLVWRRLQPTLELAQVNLGGAEPLAFRRVRLGFSLLDLVVGHIVPRSLDVAGGAVVIERDANGHWIVHGWTSGSLNTGGKPPPLDEISVEDIALQVHSAQPKLLVDVLVLGGIVRRRSDGFRLRAEFIPPPQIASMGTLSGSFDGKAMHPETWEGDGTLELSDLRGLSDFGGWLAPGTSITFHEAAAQVSAHVEHGVWRSAHLDLQAGSVRARRQGVETEALHGVVLQVAGEHPGPDWGLELRRLSVTGSHGAWPDAHGHLTLSPHAGGAGMTLSGSLDFVRLDDVLPWFWLWKGARSWPTWIKGLRGDLSKVDSTIANLSSHEPPQLSLHAQVHALGWPADADRPGMQGLSGSLVADQTHGVFALSGGPVRVSWPRGFDQEIPFDAVDGTLSWTYSGNGAWTASIPDFSWRAIDTRGKGSVAFAMPGAGASLTTHIALRAEVANAMRLLPLLPRTWGADCRAWLRRSIRGGRIQDVRLVLDGPMQDYPFDHHPTGKWALDFDAQDATLAFSPEWPAVEGLAAHVALRGNGIQIQSHQGHIQALQIQSLDARIPDFDTGQLVIDGTSRGGAKDYFAVLAHSPIAKRFSGLLSRTRWEGPADNSLHLQIALMPKLDVNASGQFRVDGDTLQVAGLDAPLQQLTGAADFGPQGVQADHLTATLLKAPLQGSITTDASHPDGVLRAQATVDFDAADGLAAHYLPAGIRRHLHGSTALAAELGLSAADQGLRLHSDLVGVRSDFPAPLQKEASATSAIDIRISSAPSAPLLLGIELPDTLGAMLRFAGPSEAPQLKAVGVRLGPGTPPTADADGIRISGHPARLFLNGWSEVFGSAKGDNPKAGAASLAFASADVTADQVLWGGFTMGATHLRVASAPGGFTADLDGAGAAGHIDYQRDPASVKAHLDHLLLEPQAKDVGETPPSSEPFDPASAPTLDVRCEQLKMSDMLLGTLSLHTTRVADGQRLDVFDVSQGKLSLKAAGTWRRTPGGSSAETGFSLKTEDISPLLTAFGYQDTVQAHHAEFIGQLAWPKTSEGLTLARAQGQVKLDLGDGVLKSVNGSNAGRALGLLNLYALPRRFLLDFRDVVAKGLVFDKLTGSFKLGAGQATTDDLDIKAPSMKMQVRGRIGLAARDFDQHVTIVPEVSTTVTVGATLLGGPVGGAVALIAQEIFGKPLNKLAEMRYHVTGSWDNPQIDKSS